MQIDDVAIEIELHRLAGDAELLGSRGGIVAGVAEFEGAHGVGQAEREHTSSPRSRAENSRRSSPRSIGACSSASSRPEIFDAVSLVAIAWVGKRLIDAVVAPRSGAPPRPVTVPLTWAAIELGIVARARAGLARERLRAARAPLEARAAREHDDPREGGARLVRPASRIRSS